MVWKLLITLGTLLCAIGLGMYLYFGIAYKLHRNLRHTESANGNVSHRQQWKVTHIIYI